MATTDTGSSIMSSLAPYLIPIGFSVVGVGLFITAFVFATNYMGNSTNWHTIQKYIPGMVGNGLAGGLVIGIALVFFYYNAAPSTTIGVYVPLVMSALAMCFAYVAIAVSCMNQS